MKNSTTHNKQIISGKQCIRQSTNQNQNCIFYLNKLDKLAIENKNCCEQFFSYVMSSLHQINALGWIFIVLAQSVSRIQYNSTVTHYSTSRPNRSCSFFLMLLAYSRETTKWQFYKSELNQRSTIIEHASHYTINMIY